MGSNSYGIGLSSTPNLYANIYAQKDAAAAAKTAAQDKELSDKYAKDADKFRIDYSKIHPYHAKEAKMAVAEFMSKADELKKQFPHTYSNTEEYNNAFFNTTSKLEDLTGSSKVIYDEQKLRLEHPDKYETDPNMMKGINEANNAEVSKMLGGRNLFQYGDIAMERWNEPAAAKAIIDKTAQDELLKKDANGKVITTPVGGGTEDIYMTAVKMLNSPQLQNNTLDMWNSSPAMQRKFKTADDALNWSKGFAEQGTKEITSAIYHAPQGSQRGTNWSGNIGTSSTGTYIYNPEGISRAGQLPAEVEKSLKDAYDKASNAYSAAKENARAKGLVSEAAAFPSFEEYKKGVTDKMPTSKNPTIVLQYKGATDNPSRGFVGSDGKSVNGSPKFFEYENGEWILNIDEKVGNKMVSKKVPLLDDKGVNLDNIQADYGELDLNRFDVSKGREVIKTQTTPTEVKIKVKRKSDGKTGTIIEADFDATKYEKL